jgi:hypothetical protein
MSNPTPLYWLGIKEHLNYLHGTFMQGLIYSCATFTPSSHQLFGWNDATGQAIKIHTSPHLDTSFNLIHRVYSLGRVVSNQLLHFLQ